MFPEIIIFLLIVNLSSTGAENKLVAVTLLFRHGDRIPLEFYPNDPHKNSTIWTAPLGEITNIGKTQQYELGVWLRKSYNGFLSPIYKKKEIYVRSSDEDRCLMSAAATMAGLYLPQGNDVWNVHLHWQPIPIHSIPPEEDDISEVEISCQNYLELFYRTEEELPSSRSINEENKKLYEYLTEKSGKNITEIEGANDLYDILFIEKEIYKLTIPNWANKVYPRLQSIGDTAYKLFTSTPELTKLFVGRFFNNLSNQFKLFAGMSSNDVQQERKFKIFSGHDLEVFNILNALKVRNLKKVPYSATVIFELWRHEDEKFYVKILYKTKTHNADIVQIGDCDLLCELSKFIRIIDTLALTKEEYVKLCTK